MDGEAGLRRHPPTHARPGQHPGVLESDARALAAGHRYPDPAQGGIDTVVTAMRHGAFDFVVKPASPEGWYLDQQGR